MSRASFFAFTMTASCVAAAACGSAVQAAGPAESVIYSFPGGPSGSTPEAAPIFDLRGNLYGTTVFGGASTQCGSTGCGTVFELKPRKQGSWSESVLYSLALPAAAYPSSPLVFDAGNLYSTTDVGGTLGVAFGLAHRHGWQFQTLHDFAGGHDGQQPRAALVADPAGNLYGTTVAGGTGGSGGNGTVFQLSAAPSGWTETVIHRFYDTARGANPQAALILDSSGNLYGTTSYGGNTTCPTGCGTVFELVRGPRGAWAYRVLHAFTAVDGATPVAPLIFDGTGNLYGTANQGAGNGCFAGCGDVYELSPRKGGGWTFSVLHVFRTKDGGGPSGAMVFDTAGNLYGTTVIGGNVQACRQQDGCGVVFALSAPERSGKRAFRVLHVFNNTPDGALPSGLAIDAGNLYGTTIGGGQFSMGSVFEVTP